MKLSTQIKNYININGYNKIQHRELYSFLGIKNSILTNNNKSMDDASLNVNYSNIIDNKEINHKSQRYAKSSVYENSFSHKKDDANINNDEMTFQKIKYDDDKNF